MRRLERLEKKLVEELKEEIEEWDAEDIAAEIAAALELVRRILAGEEITVFSGEDWLLPPEDAEKVAKEIVRVLREAGWSAANDRGRVIVFPREPQPDSTTRVDRRAEDVL